MSARNKEIFELSGLQYSDSSLCLYLHCFLDLGKSSISTTEPK